MGSPCTLHLQVVQRRRRVPFKLNDYALNPFAFLFPSVPGYVDVNPPSANLPTNVVFDDCQIGNCVSRSQSARFLDLLFLTPLTIMVSAIPVFKPVYKHFVAALRVALSDRSIQENWWNWKWSWVIWGGPIGRYVRGLVLGYRVLQNEIGTGRGAKHLGDMVKQPSATLAATLVLAIILSIFTLVGSHSTLTSYPGLFNLFVVSLTRYVAL